MLIKTIKQFRKVFIAIIGFTILIIGLFLVVLPGPAFIVIPIGLSILATEFLWAKKLLNKVKEQIKKNNPFNKN
ncbi:MAG TPA: PGPGW domain-containing protein [Melioribacteraceae bacterium]|nr:PGPGW domain-containing protein [Melioribacteraceae bacterium]